MTLKPFLHYYGGKYRAAPHYPKPLFSTIIEPFAGAAGYSCRYPDRRIILIEKYPTLAEIWRYLIAVSPGEIRRIPTVECVSDLPSWVPQPGRDLVGFWLNAATVSPRKVLSAGRKKRAARGRKFEGWTTDTKARIASQVDCIRHWTIIEADALTLDPDIEATYYVDPPYSNKAGSHYVHNSVDYSALASWCMRANGQVIACENDGATWLPFRPFMTLKPSVNGKGSREVIWTK